MMEVVVQQLVDAAEALLVPLRMGQGLDDQALANLELALDEFARQWRSEPLIPKRAASVLAEIWPAMEASSELYADERGPRIREEAVRLSDRVFLCFVEDGPE